MQPHSPYNMGPNSRSVVPIGGEKERRKLLQATLPVTTSAQGGVAVNPVGFCNVILVGVALLGVSIAGLVVGVNTQHNMNAVDTLAKLTDDEVRAIKANVERVRQDVEKHSSGLVVQDRVFVDVQPPGGARPSLSAMQSISDSGLSTTPTTTTYTLKDSYTTREDMLTAAKWRCYMGRTAYQAWSARQLTGLDWYKVNNYDLITTYAGQPQKLMELDDPTNGMQSYELGCTHLDMLITDRKKTGGTTPAGFMLKAFKTMKNEKILVDAGPKNPKYAYDGELATLRLENVPLFPSSSGTNTLFAIKVHKLPTSCGSWPAFWAVSSTTTKSSWDTPSTTGGAYPSGWPTGGEIDIIEQVNGVDENHVTMHTSSGCKAAMSVGGGSGVAGATGPPDCNTEDGKTGCSINLGDGTGSSAVAAATKGVIYLCQWIVSEYIQCWTVVDPVQVPLVDAYLSTATTTASINWGDLKNKIGNARWSHHDLKAGCAAEDTFVRQHLVINTAVCGDWAGKVACDRDGINYPEVDRTDPVGTSYECAKAIRAAIKDIAPYDTEADVVIDMQWEIEYIKTFDAA